MRLDESTDLITDTGVDWFVVARWAARRYSRGTDHPEHDEFRSIALVGIAEAWAAIGGTVKVRKTFGKVAVSAARFAVLREIKRQRTLKIDRGRELTTDRIDWIAYDESGKWIGPEAVDNRDQVSALVRRLTDRQREIVARRMRGETVEEIDESTGVPHRTVMREFKRAMIRLREATDLDERRPTSRKSNKKQLEKVA